METITVQECYRQASQAMNSGESGKAIALSEHVLETYPQAIEAHFILGEALAKAGRLEEAIVNFDQVLAKDPLHAVARRAKGLACRDLGRTAEAARELELALEADPTIENVRDELVSLYGRNPELGKQAVRLNRIGLARLYTKDNLLVQAAAEYRSILETEPNRLDVKLALAEVLWKAGRGDEAASISEGILAYDPECFRANLILAGLHAISNRAEASLAFLERVREEDPSGDLARGFVSAAGVPIDWLAFQGEDPAVPAFSGYADVSSVEAGVTERVDDVGSMATGKVEPESWRSPWAEEIEEEAEESLSAESPGGEPNLLGDAAEAEGEPEYQDVAAYLATEMGELPPDLRPFSLDELEAPAPPETGEPVQAEAPVDLSSQVAPAEETAPTVAEEPIREGAASGEPDVSIPAQEEGELFADVDLAEVLPAFTAGEEVDAGAAEPSPVSAEAAESAVPASEDLAVSAHPIFPELEAEVTEEKETWGEFVTQGAPAAPEEIPTAPEASLAARAEPEVEAPSEPLAAEPVAPEAGEPVAEEAKPVVTSKKGSPQLDVAEAHRQAGDYGRALGEYRALMKAQPELLPAVVEGLQAVLTEQPNSHAAHRLLGDAYLKQGLYEKAMREFRWVLSKPAKNK